MTGSPQADAAGPIGTRASHDVIVVGAGLTGLLTARELLDLGRSVQVLEARSPGAGTTGRSTAKISLLQGERLSRIRRYWSEQVVGAHVEAQRHGQRLLLDFCAEAGVPVQHREAVTWTATNRGVRTLQAEHRVAHAVGLPVALVTEPDADVPFAVRASLRLPDQAQVDPHHLVAALTADVQRAGGTVRSGVRATGVRVDGRRCRVDTNDGPVISDHVVLATGMPMLDRGGHFATMDVSRSCTVAADLTPEQAERWEFLGMYLSVDHPVRSVRLLPGSGRTPARLLVGGTSYTTGRSRSPRALLDELGQWVHATFPDLGPLDGWTAQDFLPHAELPMVGAIPGTDRRVLTATGYAKWGFTNAAAAATRLSRTVVGGPQEEWAEVLEQARPHPAHLVRSAMSGLGTARALAGGWARALRTVDRPDVVGVGRRGLRPVARSGAPDSGCLLSAVCTHQGAILSWNDAERSWDCPLHGSRFDTEGAVLEGPATRPLRQFSGTSRFSGTSQFSGTSRSPTSDGDAG